VKFDFIAAENATKSFDVEFMCRMLGVSTSGYYASRTRRICQRELDDLTLVPLIHAEFKKYPRGCGSRTIVGALKQQGYHVSRKRVVRLMAEEKLRCRLKRRFVVTTNSKHRRPVASNVLNRAFEPGPSNRAWAADITCLYTRRGWAYLAVVLDLGSRRVVGWSVGPTMEGELALNALKQAFDERRPPAGLVHHSDRGTQYASYAYQALLAEHGAICSMSRKGNCWDNAVVESFFSSLKRELPNDHVFEDWHEVERAAFAHIEAHYNTNRRHSALGYVSPNEYERRAA
jgi:transposase InsO family protein